VRLLGFGNAADPVGDILNIGGGDLAAMVLPQIRADGMDVGLRVLVRELLGKASLPLS
jgi:hypothetical protein